MYRHSNEESSQTRQSWYAMIATIEAALFICVQAVMVISVVLVAARAIAAA